VRIKRPLHADMDGMRCMSLAEFQLITKMGAAV